MIAKQIVNERLESFLLKAREAGIRVTPQRLEIFKIVASSENHPGAEEVRVKLGRNYPMISLDTVYRTLRLLEELGLVSAVGPHHETLRFDANTRPHHHFTCLRCGLIKDFEDTRLDRIGIPAATQEFGQPQDLRVDVRGICNACLKRTKKSHKSR